MNEFLENFIKERKEKLPELSSFYNNKKIFFNKLGINSLELLKEYIKLSNLNIKFDFQIEKNAYPNRQDNNPLPTYDLMKWFKTTQNMYILHSQGISLQAAFNQTTQEWDFMEKNDFKRWLSFYQEEADKKYKKAQISSFINPNSIKAQIPGVNINPAIQQNLNILEDPNKLLAKKIQGIVGRLNAAERLATSDPEIRAILSSKLDIDLDQWLELLHRVKRMIQTAPIKNIYSSLLEDLIIKEAGILEKKGFLKAAKELIFIAQDQQNPQMSPPIAPVMQQPAMNVPVIPQEESLEGQEAIDELIDGMNGGNNKDDVNNIVDPVPDDLANIRILAQDATTETVVHEDEESVAKNKINRSFDDALKNITVHDVIFELEEIANIFRTREIPRRLARVDLMMDQLNISSFFPILAEAANKSLESNQYALTRVEEMLSKLRGVINSPSELDLVPENVSPETPIQNQLEKQRNIEQVVKEKRKLNNQMQELQEKSTNEKAPSSELLQANPQLAEQMQQPQVQQNQLNNT